MDVIVGTAGHVDHGKTALVKALTGTDADRLPEEKRRGITIDLGFAEMKAGGVTFGFVDVPGHERFVKNMLAGASGIDLVLLVIAADESVMPQSREHFDICRLLGVKNGVIAVTKADLVDDELLAVVESDVRDLTRNSFLENAPLVAISSRTGSGIPELRSALIAAAENVPARRNELIARLPIDRSFSVKGYGAVVTGTLASGSLSDGCEAELLPSKKRVRIRGIQSYGERVGESTAGRRTAVNLAGIDLEDLTRGMLLAEPGVLDPANIFDAAVELLYDAARPLRSRQRVRLHTGTAEVLARLTVVGPHDEIVPGECGWVQLRTESPLAAVSGDRFILRSYSPQVTIGGGSVLRPARHRIRRKDRAGYTAFLSELEIALGSPERTLELHATHANFRGIEISEIRAATGWRQEALESAIKQVNNSGTVRRIGPVLIATSEFQKIASSAVAAVDSYHKTAPLEKGIPIQVLRENVFRHVHPDVEAAVLADLSRRGVIVTDGDIVTLSSHTIRFSDDEAGAVETLRAIYTKAGLDVPKLDSVLSQVSEEAGLSHSSVRKLIQFLLDSGEVVRVSSEYLFSSGAVNDLLEKLTAYRESSTDRLIDVATFKELAGVSRKFAIPLLEYLDQQKVTVRKGDKRLII